MQKKQDSDTNHATTHYPHTYSKLFCWMQCLAFLELKLPVNFASYSPPPKKLNYEYQHRQSRIQNT